MSGSHFDPSQDLMYIPTCDIGPFDGFFGLPQKTILIKVFR